MHTNRIIGLVCAVSIAAMICLAKDKVQTKAAPKTAVAATPAIKPRAAKESQDVNRLPVIGHLETRDKVITMKSGPDGLLYLVRTKDGKILHENLSEEQLKAQAPEIHELIKTSVAGTSGKDGAFMDGRLTISK